MRQLSDIRALSAAAVIATDGNVKRNNAVNTHLSGRLTGWARDRHSDEKHCKSLVFIMPSRSRDAERSQSSRGLDSRPAGTGTYARALLSMCHRSHHAPDETRQGPMPLSNRSNIPCRRNWFPQLSFLPSSALPLLAPPSPSRSKSSRSRPSRSTRASSAARSTSNPGLLNRTRLIIRRVRPALWRLLPLPANRLQDGGAA